MTAEADSVASDSHYFDDLSSLHLRWRSESEESLGLLWFQLLRFYTVEFDTKHLISLKQSKVMERGKEWPGNRLALEREYTHTNTQRLTLFRSLKPVSSFSLLWHLCIICLCIVCYCRSLHEQIRPGQSSCQPARSVVVYPPLVFGCMLLCTVYLCSFALSHCAAHDYMKACLRHALTYFCILPVESKGQPSTHKPQPPAPTPPTSGGTVPGCESVEDMEVLDCPIQDLAVVEMEEGAQGQSMVHGGDERGESSEGGKVAVGLEYCEPQQGTPSARLSFAEYRKCVTESRPVCCTSCKQDGHRPEVNSTTQPCTLCLCVHACVCVCMCACVHAYLCVCACGHVCLRACVYACVGSGAHGVCVCVCACVRACVPACVRAYMRVHACCSCVHMLSCTLCSTSCPELILVLYRNAPMKPLETSQTQLACLDHA